MSTNRPRAGRPLFAPGTSLKAAYCPLVSQRGQISCTVRRLFSRRTSIEAPESEPRSLIHRSASKATHCLLLNFHRFRLLPTKREAFRKDIVGDSSNTSSYRLDAKCLSQIDALNRFANDGSKSCGSLQLLAIYDFSRCDLSTRLPTDNYDFVGFGHRNVR